MPSTATAFANADLHIRTRRVGDPLNLTISETCQALRVSRSTLYRLTRKGELKTGSVGRRVLIPMAEIERLQTRLIDGKLRAPIGDSRSYPPKA